MVISSAVSSVAPVQETLRLPQMMEENSLIRALANSIESTWQSYLDLSPYPIPEGFGYVEGGLQGERLVIENRCYQSSRFRKLHLELAQVGDRLQILHCVMFPRLSYDLPIFGADLVGQSHRISAAIADLSPTTLSQPAQGNCLDMSRTLALSPNYQKELSRCPHPSFCKPRELPEWGDIFSEFCLFVAPQSKAEEQQFLQYVQTILMLHCQLIVEAQPLGSEEERIEVRIGHQNYCEKQCKNDKTRRVLETSFGKAWADRYMRTMLFDLAA